MTDKQDPQTPNFDSSFQGDVSLSAEIAMLRQIPEISGEDLFSSKKMQSSEYHDKPGVRVALGTPIETAVSSRSDVEQDLIAIVALGMDVALGVVKGSDHSGSEVSYLSLLINNPSGDEGRARFIDVLAEGTPVTIGRDIIEQVVGRKGAVPGVSGTHCTIELRGGVLTVIDQTSLNGTSVFTATTNDPTRHRSIFNSIQAWSQPSGETKKLIEAKEAERLSKVSQLGRFTADNG